MLIVLLWYESVVHVDRKTVFLCLTALDEIQEYSEQAGESTARAAVHQQLQQQSLRKRRRRRQSRGLRREWQVSTSTPCWQNDGVGYYLCVGGFKATGLCMHSVKGDFLLFIGNSREY